VTYDPADVRAAQEHFGFARPAPIEKDWHILRAMRAIIGVETGPFRLVFAGGTCLARAHKLVYRMSEDVDFKVAPIDNKPVSKTKRRRDLGNLRDRITEGLQAAGFAIEPANSPQVRSRDDNRYTLYQLPYGATEKSGQPLKPSIQVELNYVILRLAPVRLPVASFIAEAFGHPPEVPDVACVSVDETAGEKLVSLTRRTAMELAGLGHGPDPTLVRHIYDLHVMRAHYNAATSNRPRLIIDLRSSSVMLLKPTSLAVTASPPLAAAVALPSAHHPRSPTVPPSTSPAPRAAQGGSRECCKFPRRRATCARGTARQLRSGRRELRGESA
jgi:predicted nucleotidyltransferase component of viral defense system